MEECSERVNERRPSTLQQVVVLKPTSSSEILHEFQHVLAFIKFSDLFFVSEKLCRSIYALSQSEVVVLLFSILF